MTDDDADWDDEPDVDDDDDLDTRTFPCPGCGQDVYEDAVRCPLCGEYILRRSTALSGHSLGWIVLGILGIIAVVAALLCGFLGFAVVG